MNYELERKEERERIEALMAEGYQAMSEENLQEVEEAFPLMAEVVLRDDQEPKER